MNNSCLGCQAALLCVAGVTYLNIGMDFSVNVWLRHGNGGFSHICYAPQGCPEVASTRNGGVRIKRKAMKGSMLVHGKMGQ